MKDETYSPAATHRAPFTAIWELDPLGPLKLLPPATVSAFESSFLTRLVVGLAVEVLPILFIVRGNHLWVQTSARPLGPRFSREGALSFLPPPP